MTTYFLRISILNEDADKFPKDKTLEDILGKEVGNYWLGSGGDKTERDVVFNRVPGHIMDIVRSRVRPYKIIKLSIHEETEEEKNEQEEEIKRIEKNIGKVEKKSNKKKPL